MLTNKNAATKKKWEEWEERRQMEQRWQALSQCDESEYSTRVPQFFFQVPSRCTGRGHFWHVCSLLLACLKLVLSHAIIETGVTD